MDASRMYVWLELAAGFFDADSGEEALEESQGGELQKAIRAKGRRLESAPAAVFEVNDDATASYDAAGEQP